MTSQAIERFTAQRRCPVCGGYDGMPRGAGSRCYGFTSGDGDWAHCTREDFANGLPLSPSSNTYPHKLTGDCGCGVRHDPRPRPSDNGRRPQVNRSKTPVATYDYRNENGDLRYQVLRYRYDDNGEKTFRVRRPDGHGESIWNLDGVCRVPYKLPELLAAPADTTVFLVEGEEDVDRLSGQGLVATTSDGGAGQWRAEFNSYFEGRPVVILPDNDRPGLRYAHGVARCLTGVAASIKVVELPSLAEGEDVSDWLNDRDTTAELEELVGSAPTFGTSESPMLGDSEEKSAVTIIPSADIPPPDTGGENQELLGPFVPTSPCLVLMSGETSAGKTVYAYNMGYHMAEGVSLVGLTPPRPLRVLYVDLENPDSVHRYLVDTIGRSLNLAFVRDLRMTLDTPDGHAAFLDACRQYQPSVVFLDPLSVVWPVRDENDNAEADRQMWGLKKMAVELDSTVVGLWNMGEGHVKEKFRARGATARLDRTDLGLNYTELTDTTRQLKVVKSRYGTLGLTVAVKFAGDMGFEAIQGTDGQTPSNIAKKQEELRTFLGDGRPRQRKELVSALDNEDLVDKALKNMRLGGEVDRPKRGVYQLRVSSEPPSLSPNPPKDGVRTAEGGG